VRELNLPTERLESLGTAVAEATMNAIEYGNQNNPELRVAVGAWASDEKLVVRITDRGEGNSVPTFNTPDLDAKLAGLQSPRGWGLFLIRSLVDEVQFIRDPETRYLTIELTMKLKEKMP
jgi:anti-sigma regulatory factor (Ser/Thr protein kinase)